MSKPIYYFKITEEIDNIARNLYFISKSAYSNQEIEEFNNLFMNNNDGIINCYTKCFPNRKISISNGKYLEEPIANENNIIYKVKHSIILADSFVKLSEMAYNDLFTCCDLYKEKGLFAFYDNYEIKERMHYLNRVIEGDFSPSYYSESEIDEIDNWIYQSNVF
jgi:hypothetical protein